MYDNMNNYYGPKIRPSYPKNGHVDEKTGIRAGK